MSTLQREAVSSMSIGPGNNGEVAAAVQMLEEGLELKDLAAADQANRQVVTAAVRIYAPDLRWASEAFRDEPGVVLAAVEQEGGGFALHWASERLRADRDIVLAAVQSTGCALKFASEELQADRDVILAAAQTGSDEDNQSLNDMFENSDMFEFSDAEGRYKLEVLQFASEAIRSDKQVVIAAVTTEAGNFRHASPELRRDPDVINAAWENEPAILSTLDPDVAASLIDRTFALAVVERAPLALEYLSAVFKADREIVHTAVRHKAYCMRFASEALRADRELAEIAVTNDGSNVQFLAPALQCDREILLKSHESSLSFISEKLATLGDLCNDRKFILPILHKCQKYTCFLPQKYCQMPQYCLGILRQAGSALRGDKEIITAAVACTSEAFSIASWELKSNKAFVLQLVSTDGGVLRHASIRLRADKEVVMAAVRQSGISLEWADAGLKADQEVVRAAVAQSLDSIEHISEDLKADKTFMLIALKKAPESTRISYRLIQTLLPTVLTSDSEVMQAAILADNSLHGEMDMDYILSEVPENLRKNVAFLQGLAEGFRQRLCAANQKLCRMSKTAKTNEAVLQRHAANTLPQQLWEGREEGNLVSVDLVSSDGNRVAAHCEILSLRSSVFSSMFASNFIEGQGSDRKEVLIADVDSETLLEMVRWVYTGAVAEGVLERLAYSLFQVANKYDMTGLQSAAQKAIVSSLQPQDAIRMLQLADRHSVEDFKLLVADFICQHWEEVMQTEEACSLKALRSPLIWELYEKELSTRSSKKRSHDEL